MTIPEILLSDAYWPWLMAAAVVGAAVGALAVWALSHPRKSRLRDRNLRLAAELQTEKRLNEERQAVFEQARKQLAESFSALSVRALRDNNEAFLSLAEEQFKRHQQAAGTDLKERHQAIETLMNPVRDALKKTEKQIRAMELERKQAYGGLQKHLEGMAQGQKQLREETSRLVQALRKPEVRGRWGELTLRRLVELAGLVDRCDFYEQEYVSDDEGTYRPDMVIRLPDDREIIVDVKTPLDAYLDALDANNDEDRNKHLARHAKLVRDRIKELSDKKYWAQFKRSPDFVVLFIPGEQYLAAALDVDHTLLEDALGRQIILATPTSLVALLRAIAFSWRQVSVIQNAEAIRSVGEEFYTRVSTLVEHLSNIGKSLDRTVNSYNKAVGSLERSVLPSARRLSDMGISSHKELKELEPVERLPRQPADKETS
ncbi:MAG: DNA recombination protein RmuC [Gammaproteobacteria bacterium]|nr:MAG: DNA recombination protein RmuC [Gammaproteobacteria bacterium]